MNSLKIKNIISLAGILTFLLTSCVKEDYFWNRKLNSFSGEFLLINLIVEDFDAGELIDRSRLDFGKNSKMIFFSTQNEATDEYFGNLMIYNNNQLDVKSFTYKSDGERLILKSATEFNGPFDFSIVGNECRLVSFSIKFINGKEIIEKRTYSLIKVPLSR